MICPNNLRLTILCPRHVHRWAGLCAHTRNKKKTYDLRKKGNVRKISSLGGKNSLATCLSSRNKTLVIAIKKHAKVDIKLFWPFPVLLDFSALFQIFCPELHVPFFATISSSRPLVFLEEGVVRICSKFTEGHPCRSPISIKVSKKLY